MRESGQLGGLVGLHTIVTSWALVAWACALRAFQAFVSLCAAGVQFPHGSFARLCVEVSRGAAEPACSRRLTALHPLYMVCRFHYTFLAWLPTYFTNVLSLDLTRAAQVGLGLCARIEHLHHVWLQELNQHPKLCWRPCWCHVG